MPWYTARSTPTGIRFAKFDDDQREVEATYTVSADGRFCDCPSGHRANCKHREMRLDFLATGAIDTGRFYSPDLRQWRAPIRVEPETLRRI